jgi:proteasome lid subunit RPN8/RPN11
MYSTVFDAELDLWQAAGCEVSVEYSRAVMEQLRLDAVDGFHRLAHGGVEIGGVLFGVRDARSLDRCAVKVLAHKALACEYAYGPSFTLSENDRCALERLLLLPNAEAELSGMEPVGWYLSHTRSEILLSEKDLELYQRYFSKPWQIALVLRPHRFDPVRAGFFFREPDGAIHAQSSRHEFLIAPVGRKPATSLSVGPPSPIEPSPIEPSPPLPSPPLPSQPAESQPATSRYPGRRLVWTAAAIAILVAGGLFWIRGARPLPGVSLQAIDEAGQLQIHWDRNSQTIRQSRGGALEIEDGPTKVQDELSQENLHSGNVIYLRNTGSVLIRLLVRGPDGSVRTEVIRFLGAPVATAGVVPPEANPGAKAQIDAEAISPASKTSTVSRDRARKEIEPATSPSRPLRRLVSPTPARAPASEPAFPSPPSAAANGVVAAPLTFLPRLPTTVPAPVPPPMPQRVVDSLPHDGRIIWIGKLARNATIQILGNHASPGQITGALPGTPVRVQVLPAEMTHEGVRIFTADAKSVVAPEAPGAQNGWNRTEYVLNPRKAGEIHVVEAPNPQNGWNRLVLRAERGDHSIIVLRWERIAADTACSPSDSQ